MKGDYSQLIAQFVFLLLLFFQKTRTSNSEQSNEEIAISNAQPLTLPSFPLSSLKPKDKHFKSILKQVERSGIGLFSISNIPQFSTLRKMFFDTASNCIKSQERTFSTKVLKETLLDGTIRKTISAQEGQKTFDESVCPQYTEVNNLLTDTIMQVAQSFAVAIDSITETQSTHPLESLKDIVNQSVRIDHFHAYSKSNLKLSTPYNQKISLKMHTDAGLFIVMMAPEFYVNEEDKASQFAVEAEEKSGLFVEDNLGNLRWPKIPRDELIFMIGEGFSSWSIGFDMLRPVVHGMYMPKAFQDGTLFDQSMMRSWYGKMFLPPKNFKMKNTSLDFSDYAIQSTKFVLGGQQNALFSSLACSSGRFLTASVPSECTVQTCHNTSGSLVDTCNYACNAQMKPQQDACEKWCSCQASAANSGAVCWMLCVKDLECPANQAQACQVKEGKIQQALVCNQNNQTSTTSTAKRHLSNWINMTPVALLILFTMTQQLLSCV
jgi:hypothetical protein